MLIRHHLQNGTEVSAVAGREIEADRTIKAVIKQITEREQNELRTVKESERVNTYH